MNSGTAPARTGLSRADLLGLRRAAIALAVIAYIAVFADGLLEGASELVAMGRAIAVALALAVVARLVVAALAPSTSTSTPTAPSGPAVHGLNPLVVPASVPDTTAPPIDHTAEPATADTRRPG